MIWSKKRDKIFIDLENYLLSGNLDVIEDDNKYSVAYNNTYITVQARFYGQREFTRLRHYLTVFDNETSEELYIDGLSEKQVRRIYNNLHDTYHIKAIAERRRRVRELLLIPIGGGILL